LLGEGIARRGGSYKVTEGLLNEFGSKRVIDTPLAEATFTGAGVGAALTGMRPVVEILFIDFSMLILDQIANQAAKLQFMTNKQCSVPMVCAIRSDFPVVFIEHKLLYMTEGEVPEEEYLIPFGEARIKRPGNDLTLVAWSNMIPRSLKAAESLAEEGIDIEVVDPRTLVPLDKKTIVDSVRKTQHLVIVQEAVRRGGVASDIASYVHEEAFDYLDAPIEIVAGLNTPIPYNLSLEEACIPQEVDIIEAVRRALARTV